MGIARENPRLRGLAMQAPVTALALVLYAATACTPAAESPSSPQISDSAGWRIVHNGNTRRPFDPGWSAEAEPEVVIGALDGPEEYQFVQVEDAARLSDGSVVVVDRGARTVRLFEADGTFRNSLGGPGAGPGEFSDPVSVQVTPGDTMVIWDQALLRATRFSPAGEVVAVQTVDWGTLASRLGLGAVSKTAPSDPENLRRSSGLLPGPMEPLSGGGFLVRLVEKGVATPGSGRYRPPSGLLRVSGDLAVIDTLMLFGDTEQVVVDAPWGPFSIAPPGARNTRVAHSEPPPRICIGEQRVPEILCFHDDGKDIALRWTADPLPFTEEDLVAWREGSVRLLDPKLGRSQVLDMLDQVPVPEYLPPYSRIFLDPDGDLWAELGSARGGDEDPAQFLVFDPAGILLGKLELPAMRTLEIGTDYVLGVHENRLGIQHVRIHALEKTSSGRE